MPYVDFGIWNTYGPRLAKFQDFDAQIFVQGQLVTKRVAAPSSLAGWMACWDLYEVAMVSLGAASLGALRAYADGIRDLALLFPNKWGIVVTTDLVVRAERWAHLRERCDRDPPTDFEAKRPWNYVIATSAHGSHDLRVQAWWQRTFVLPATLTT